MVVDLGHSASQAVLAELVGVSQQAISALQTEGKLPPSGTVGQMLQAYCQRLREQAAGRMGDSAGGLDLAQERAALARSQREGIEIRNATLRGEFVSVALLSQILAAASQAIADRFDHLPARVKKAFPDLPPTAIDEVMVLLASARNEWVRQTNDLMVDKIAAMGAEDDDPETPADDPPTD